MNRDFRIEMPPSGTLESLFQSVYPIGELTLAREPKFGWLGPPSNEVELAAFTLAPKADDFLAELPGTIAECTCHSTNRQYLVGDLSGISVNGKLLARPSLQEACRRCYDVDFRNLSRRDDAAAPDIQKAIRQGLWLEHLVADACLLWTRDVWVGVMQGLFELDVIAMIDGQRVLFECKDTSLGQNDFFIALKKAHTLQVDLLTLVATQPLHSNVVTAINAELDRAYEDGDSVIIPVVDVCASASSDIAQQVSTLLRDLRQLTFYHWLEYDHTSAASSRFFDIEPYQPMPNER